MKKILLASMSIEENSRFDFDCNSAYPLGLCYLMSVLEENGYEVKLLFLNNDPYEIAENIILKCIDEWKPEIIGFQVFSMTRVSTFKIINKIQEQNEGTKIIIGGVHASIMYDQILREYPKVIAVKGEGEKTIIELLESIENNIPLRTVRGIAYNENGNVIQTEERELISDLDTIPFPRHGVFFDNYPNRKVAHIVSSRGCPFKCSFCCLRIMSHQRLRKRKIENVIEEIKYLKTKYPRLSHVQFHDDTFLMDNDRVILFCKLLIKEKLDITFECSARVKPVCNEMFTWLERAGCTKIMFGLESGSEKILNSIHKGITQKDVIELFYLLRDHNITVTTFLMCGFPGENEETIHETISFVQKIQKIKYSWIAGVGKLWVYPGTEVYKLMRNQGAINDDYWLTENDVPFYTVENSYQKLLEYENKVMDNVSLERIFTIKGFVGHFLKMPIPIMIFIINNPSHLFRLLIVKNKYLYNMLRTIKTICNKIRANE